ncbi:efflux RND transporter periplasmic adaptor subunit [Actinoplanes sichuanensis]|nr:efflux RND transporter periplasmic adaptor subunit [Actinoplanes sichuanensis]BEL08011.1 efflux RND transporter periplasmic adaptor subunit [Actinoplanes sichuanensis]
MRWTGAAIVVSGAVVGGVIGALNRDGVDQPAAIVVAVADRGAVTLDVATIGTVEPATTRSLTFALSGTVASVHVRAGNKVSKGQKLAALDTTDAADALADARTALAEARDRLSDSRTVAARATASATACARPGKTVEPAAVPEIQLPVIEPMAVEPAPSAEPAIRGRAATPCATHGYPDTGSDQVLTAEQQVNRAERAVETAQRALDGTVITAPIAGTVVAVEGKVGDQVRTGSTFVSLADTYTMQVRADFPEADAGALTAGQGATVSLADSDDTYQAEVVQVDPAGTSDGTLVRYGVLLSFADSPSDLLVGQSAQVQVRTGEVADALRVPSTAVHDVSGGSGTVLVRAANRSEERVVAVGLRGDRYTEITGGLEQGDQVVRSW